MYLYHGKSMTNLLQVQILEKHTGAERKQNPNLTEKNRGTKSQQEYKS